MKDISIIPVGPYCYTPVGWDGLVYKVKPCPYYERRGNYGHCNYLEKGDMSEENPTSLLWDQVKECGINEE